MERRALGGRFDAWVYHDPAHPVPVNSFVLRDIRAIGAALTVCSADLLDVLDALGMGPVTVHRVWLPPSEEAAFKGPLSERGLNARYDDTSEMHEPCLKELFGNERLRDLEQHYSQPSAQASPRAEGRVPSANRLGLKRSYVGQGVVVDGDKGEVVSVQGVEVDIRWERSGEVTTYSPTKDRKSWIYAGKSLVW
jgi:hypothetical protein